MTVSYPQAVIDRCIYNDKLPQSANIWMTQVEKQLVIPSIVELTTESVFDEHTRDADISIITTYLDYPADEDIRLNV